tara:strand:+ start:1337 stop:1693 length:357 start_codon:yes stop_codon:yes gene_type:complete
VHNFKELKIWQKARILVKQVYVVSNELPDSERFNLISQMRSASVSIMSCIAEGSGRGSDQDFARFLDMSLGSCHEVESLLFVALDLDYIDQIKHENLTSSLSEIQKMIVAFIKKLRNH